MQTISVDILLLIAVISGLTELIKRIFLKSENNDYACFVALAFGLIYIFLKKYVLDLYPNIDWIDAIVLGLAIGLAASGGYENIKNLLSKGKQLFAGTDAKNLVKSDLNQ
ncbi:MAG: hypothetical protein UR28_C0021G0006 [Candidatus Peregrinibacteria bacterium GW2011_GWF2_33_10]|nr:MAG: hypothetical protein UR28_C0021G0006 [Candidatus Peregrinibacteria bacterium GW2011_GWF2_33_10]OGJ44103.1 MAG: hypothetical protein A2272_00350 [Candidatus Peregrinibacteria bacterium RIFOXYA12_FULL_33_12]OGJ44382.1 MAG: hypothetical protein A2263_05840 [Candidatus Peregrinibacteria bacterium RIFOXYA2_FULL_33_21]OGJ50177.1 MAG: hypothetical protein A2307_03330 [Candidatus Peregrinibacteria bacterium RIFOXYB2_FULL_33_20]